MDFNAFIKSSQTETILELECVKLLLEKAGNPDKALKIIHVAGTNGKGSVCAFISEGLKHMKICSGWFSSPSLFNVYDTINVDGQKITENEYMTLAKKIEPLCTEIKDETGKMPSQFEINFVLALLYFNKKKCSVCILECGMGGAGDATNAIDESAVCVICKIALDHMAYLGNTVEEIAENKCKIFKKNSVVVTVSQTKQVERIIKKCAGDRELFVAKPFVSSGDFSFGECVNYKSEKNIRLSLCGFHQTENAAAAARVLEIMGASEKDIRFALENAVNRARFEKIGDKLWFDGAHNADGVHVLVQNINRYVHDKKIAFVCGFMADKDIKSAISELKNLKCRNFMIYTTTVHSNARSESGQELAKMVINSGFSAESSENVNTAINKALENSDLCFVFGSLYMYKEITVIK